MEARGDQGKDQGGTMLESADHADGVPGPSRKGADIGDRYDLLLPFTKLK